MAIYPFSSLKYNQNPSFWQPGQTVTITPFPGTSGISFAITSGTLPSGLSINSTTGVISGTAGSVIPPTSVIVGATQTDASIQYCTVIIAIEDIPALAPTANQASATGLTDLQAVAAQNFIAAANQIISNNNELGLFQAWFDVLPHLPIASLQAYFQSLGYTFWITQNSYNGYPVSTDPYSAAVWSNFYGGYPYSLLNYNTPEAYWYGAPQNFPPAPRILITWKSTPVYPQWPYFPF